MEGKPSPLAFINCGFPASGLDFEDILYDWYCIVSKKGANM
jgi:hypothetical protein